MKNYGLLGVVFLFIAGALTGCEIITEAPPPINLHSADHVVINEVFTLPQSNQSPYSWIELLNPTSDTVDIGRWTLTFNTYKQQITQIVVLDSNFQLRSFVPPVVSSTVFGRFDMPFAQQFRINPTTGQVIPETLLLDPNGLYTMVSNEARMKDHTAWGARFGVHPLRACRLFLS